MRQRLPTTLLVMAAFLPAGNAANALSDPYPRPRPCRPAMAR
jgi:hypothetical protein